MTEFDGTVTQADVLDRISPRVRGDFDCIRGPHDWSEGLANRYQFCLDCEKVKRIPWPDTRHLYGRRIGV